MYTIRSILSFVSSLYDPLGLAAPMILPAKRLLQKMCKENLGWDDVICSDDLVRWSEWSKDITGLSDMKVPRCVKPKHFRKVDSFQLHYFSDASEEGYGVVSYLRIIDSQGNIACSILLGKARVPPLKTRSQCLAWS